MNNEDLQKLKDAKNRIACYIDPREAPHDDIELILSSIPKLIARIDELDTPFCVKCGSTEICDDAERSLSSVGAAGEPAQLAVTTHAGAHATTVVVDLKQGDVTTRIYSRDHVANGESVGVSDLPTHLFAAPAPVPTTAQQEPVVPDLSNLTRYDTSETDNEFLGGPMSTATVFGEQPDGDYVLLSDVKALYAAAQAPDFTEARAAMERAKRLPVWDDINHKLHVELDVIFKALSLSSPSNCPDNEGGDHA